MVTTEPLRTGLGHGKSWENVVMLHAGLEKNLGF